MSDIRYYLSPSALRPLPYKGKVRSIFIFVQNIFSDKSFLLLLYYILPTYVCRVSVGFISMLLTYISDISVGKHLPYRISKALKPTLFSVFFSNCDFFFFVCYYSTVCVSFFLDCVTLPPSLSLLPCRFRLLL